MNTPYQPGQTPLQTPVQGDFFSQQQTPQGNTSNQRPLADVNSNLKGKNPVSVLNEVHPTTVFHLVAASKTSSPSPQFCVRATLGDLSFEGKAITKKLAKQAASKALLDHLDTVGFVPMTGRIQEVLSLDVVLKGSSPLVCPSVHSIGTQYRVHSSGYKLHITQYRAPATLFPGTLLWRGLHAGAHAEDKRPGKRKSGKDSP